MIALDTNVVVRLLVEDDPVQTAISKDLLESAAATHEKCFLSNPVLCELEWVLDSCYSVPRSKVLSAIQELANNSHFAFENRAVLKQALDAFAAGKADFSDYLIGSTAQAEKARATYTFDRALRDTEGFVLLAARR